MATIAVVTPTKEINPLLAGTPPLRPLSLRENADIRSSLLAPPLSAAPSAYLQSLATRPLLTKSLTSGSLACVHSHALMRFDRALTPIVATRSFLSEIVAGHLAGSPPPPLSAKERTGILPLDVLKRNHKAIKLGLYGFFISAPLGHTLLAILQRVFKGKTSARSKLAMIICSNLFISPIQQSIYIAAMAIIGGATSPAAILKAWKMSFWSVMRFTWVVSTLSMGTAQRFLAPELCAKKRALAAKAAKAAAEEKSQQDDEAGL
ncbi:SPOSA6832_00206 [Sporobolomyces salmonicolor]|uniref:SPOSA6832_00206-mRNA-1:cds n=1 Tax=Sporidiobolus salmonicolor TaxID=5005 RepID=A0A0D6EFS0_SPOSA|nr:SPOSA6832_00206 [Sporobolomyces salmonicolor]